DAFAVIELRRIDLFADRMERPWPPRLANIGSHPSPTAFPVADQLGNTIAVEIDHRRRLATNPFEREVLLPWLGRCQRIGTSRVLVPGSSVQVDPSQNEEIGPAIATEVVREREQAIGRAPFGLQWFG